MALETRSTTGTPGPWFRTLCGAFTLGLSLVCVISSLPYLTTTSGSEQLTIWEFFLWGLGLAVGVAWLIRGRSKGQDIVFVRDRKRLLAVAALTVVVIGMAIFFAGLPAEEGSAFDASLWFDEVLPLVAAGLLVAAAVLGYRLKKSRPPGPGPDASPGR